MKKQTCFQEFARYSTLSILGTLGVSCYILADTFFISKGLGTNGLAALNLIIPVYNLIYGCGLMFGMGGATKFSICKYKNDQQEMDLIFTAAVYPPLILGLVFAIAGIFFSKNLAVLLGADSNIFAMTDTYLKWMLLFAPAFMLNNVLLCFVRNDGSPQLSMIAMLVGSFSNIILDYLFIFPMNMGIFGAVLATGFSPVISIAMMSPHWLKKKNQFHLVKTIPRKGLLFQEISLGFPSLITQVSSGIVILTFNALILNLEGNTGIAAYGVIANISLVVSSIYNGLAQGVQPLLSEAYGTGKKEKIRLLLRCAVITMTVISGVVYLLLFCFACPVTQIFNSEGNLLLQKIAEPGLKLYFTSNLFVGFNILLATCLTSTEKALPAHILSLLRGLILIVPMAFLLSSLWGMTGIWLAYPVTELAVAVLGAILYFILL